MAYIPMGISAIGIPFLRSRPTVCVTRVWVGQDSNRKQKKLQAGKILEKAAESHTSAARFVRRRFVGELIFHKDIVKFVDPCK